MLLIFLEFQRPYEITNVESIIVSSKHYANVCARSCVILKFYPKHYLRKPKNRPGWGIYRRTWNYSKVSFDLISVRIASCQLCIIWNCSQLSLSYCLTFCLWQMHAAVLLNLRYWSTFSSMVWCQPNTFLHTWTKEILPSEHSGKKNGLTFEHLFFHSFCCWVMSFFRRLAVQIEKTVIIALALHYHPVLIHPRLD